MFSNILIHIFLAKIVTSITILESPESVQVIIGLPSTLKCRASAAYASITWYKDGSKHDPEKGRCLLLPDGSLFFLSTRAEDVGEYHCTVTDRSNVVRSRSASLSVLENSMEADEFIQEGYEDKDQIFNILLPRKLTPPKKLWTESYF